MAALFCAVVAARKNRRDLPAFLRILPLSPEIKTMALESYRGAENAEMLCLSVDAL